ncbi:MAG: hypothetical protein ACP5OG_03015 [Candidatus Nanoarchaeia archaeon]
MTNNLLNNKKQTVTYTGKNPILKKHCNFIAINTLNFEVFALYTFGFLIPVLPPNVLVFTKKEALNHYCFIEKSKIKQ